MKFNKGIIDYMTSMEPAYPQTARLTHMPIPKKYQSEESDTILPSKWDQTDSNSSQLQDLNKIGANPTIQQEDPNSSILQTERKHKHTYILANKSIKLKTSPTTIQKYNNAHPMTNLYQLRQPKSIQEITTINLHIANNFFNPHSYWHEDLQLFKTDKQLLLRPQHIDASFKIL